jgi:hypothetical protein
MSDAPLVSVYTVIGRNVDLLKQWEHNVRTRAGLPEDQYEVDLVLWNAEPDVLDYVKNGNFRYVTYNPLEHYPDANYVRDLYNCFNMGYEMSRAKYVLRSGSDQVFSLDYLRRSMDLILDYEKDGDRTAMYHLLTLESWDGSKSAYGRPCSRHIMPIGWWDHLLCPRMDKFDAFCEAILTPQLLTNEEYALPFLHPIKGWVFHTVGASWIQQRYVWKKFGPMMNHVGPNGLTGDVEIFDRVASRDPDFQVPSLLINDAATFHRCKGESS